MSLSVDDISDLVQDDALSDSDDASNHALDAFEDAEELTGSSESLYLEDEAGHGDATTPEPSTPSVMWKVDHSVGEYKLKCKFGIKPSLRQRSSSHRDMQVSSSSIEPPTPNSTERPRSKYSSDRTRSTTAAESQGHGRRAKTTSTTQSSTSII